MRKDSIVSADEKLMKDQQESSNHAFHAHISYSVLLE